MDQSNDASVENLNKWKVWGKSNEKNWSKLVFNDEPGFQIDALSLILIGALNAAF